VSDVRRDGGKRLADAHGRDDAGEGERKKSRELVIENAKKLTIPDFTLFGRTTCVRFVD